MTIRAGFFGVTQKEAVTGSAASFTVPGTTDSQRVYLVQSDVDIHISRTGEATTSDLRIPADTLVKVSCYAGDEISYILATGASDGSIWITQIDF